MNFLSSPGFEKYLGNTLFLLSEKIIRSIIGLTVGIMLARYLGPEKFGQLSLAQGIAFLLATLSALGLDSVVVKELVERKTKKDLILGTSFFMKLVCNLFILLGVIVIFQSTKEEIFFLVLIFTISNLLLSFQIIDFFYQSQVMSKYVVVVNVCAVLISGTLKLLCIYFQQSLIIICLIFVIESLIYAIGLLIFYFFKSNNSLFKWSFNRKLALSLSNKSLPLLLAAGSVSLYMKIDQLMIASFLGERDLGIYSAALKLSEAWYFLPVIICGSLFPSIINSKKISDRLYEERMQSLYTFLAWIAISIALVVSIFNDQLINILFGKQFESSSTVLLIHIWACVFVFIGVAFSKYLVNEGLTRIQFIRTFFGLIINILLNLLLIPKYGILGAAYALLISQIFANLIFDLFDPRFHTQFKFKLNAIMPIYLFHERKIRK